MPSLSDLVRAAQARPVPLELEPGEIYSIPPACLNQIAQCVLLDPDDPAKESAKARTVRLLRQAKILLGPDHEDLTERLGEAQIILIVGALFVAAGGFSPEDFCRWQEAQRESAISATKLELLRSLDDLTNYLVVELRDKQAGEIPLANAIAVHKRIQERMQEEFDRQIILRGGRPG